AERIRAEAGRAGRRPQYRQPVRGRRLDRLCRHHRGPAALASVLARHPDRGRPRGRRERGAVAAGRDHRLAFRRHSARIAVARAAGLLAGEGAGRAAGCHCLRAARGDRVAVVGRRGRWHDRPPPPLQLRTGGARRRQYRLGAVRRHLRHRADRPYRDQYPRRRAR
ncbi:hypothetical protein KXV85_005537, partial [Aspergillus fumigatus]